MEDENVDDIDEQIAYHERSIVILKTNRNARMRINRLPPEILSRVLSFCLHSSHLDKENLKSLITTTFVCSHWREVALCSPSLWSLIIFTYPRWVEELLLRSKMALLTVSRSLADRTHTEPKMLMVLEHLPRIRSLRLVAGLQGVDQIRNKLTSGAAFLEYFELYVTSPGELGVREAELQIPGLLFDGEAPRLQVFKLIGCAVDWEGLRFTKLVELELQNIPRIHRPSTRLLVDMLSSLDTLEKLGLLDALSYDATESMPMKPAANRVYLGRLTHFAFSGSSAVCAIVLYNVDFPSDAYLKVDCRRALTSASPNLLAALKHHFVQDAAINVAGCFKRLMSLDVDTTYGSMDVTAWTSLAGVRRQTRVPDISLSVANASQTIAGTQQLLLGVCDALPLHDLLTVSFAVDTDIPSHIWTQALEQCPGIQYASVAGESAFGFVAALTAEMSGCSLAAVSSSANHLESTMRWNSDLATTVFLPELRHLSLHDVDFESDSPTGPEDLFHVVLLDRLMERCVRDVDIHKLSIHACSMVNDDVLDDLKEVVAEVYFDGNYGVSDDEDADNYWDDDYDGPGDSDDDIYMDDND